MCSIWVYRIPQSHGRAPMDEICMFIKEGVNLGSFFQVLHAFIRKRVPNLLSPNTCFKTLNRQTTLVYLLICPGQLPISVQAPPTDFDSSVVLQGPPCNRSPCEILAR